MRKTMSWSDKTRIPYVFREHKYPGVPNLVLHTIGTKPFEPPVS